MQVYFHSLTFDTIVGIATIAVLLICSGLISASEVAFFSLRPIQLDKMSQKFDSRSKKALQCLSNPEKLLANILIANNMVNIGVVILSTYVSKSLIDFSQAPLLGFIFEVVVITFMILFVGEILPKIFAIDNPVAVSRMMAIPLYLLSFLFYPITILLLKSTALVQKRLNNIKPELSVDDLSAAIEITSDSLKDEKSILESIVKMGNISVIDIMHSRMDMVALSKDTPYRKLFSSFIETGYSRIPIYENSVDNIKGVMILKDLLPYLDEDDSFNWHALMKPIYFVPESKKIDDLLAEFQKNKMHLAVVIDEHGGTCGLVTMEDVLEEVIGEIQDESDTAEEQPYKKIAANTWLFEAKIPLNDFYKVTGVNPNVFHDVKGDFETIAGLLLEMKGTIPAKGTIIEHKNITFIIEQSDKRKIQLVKIIVKP